MEVLRILKMKEEIIKTLKMKEEIIIKEECLLKLKIKRGDRNSTKQNLKYDEYSYC